MMPLTHCTLRADANAGSVDAKHLPACLSTKPLPRRMTGPIHECVQMQRAKRTCMAPAHWKRHPDSRLSRKFRKHTGCGTRRPPRCLSATGRSCKRSTTHHRPSYPHQISQPCERALSGIGFPRKRVPYIWRARTSSRARSAAVIVIANTSASYA